MPARFPLAVVLSMACLAPSVLFAQAPAPATRITIVGSSDQAIRDDLQYLVKLAPTALHKQWKTLDETLQSFEDGVDLKRPIGVQFILGGEEMGYMPIIPFNTLEGKGAVFVNNVNGFGFKGAKNAAGMWVFAPVVSRSKKAAAGPPPKTMYMREGPNKYAVLSTDQADLPAKMPDYTAPWKNWLVGNRDIVMHLGGDASSMPARRKSFQTLRKQLEAAIKFKRGETEADYELRKVGAEQSFNESERFLIDTQDLVIAWTTDSEKNAGIGELSLAAHPGTDLAKSIDLLTTNHSYFANVAFHDKGTFQVRTNFAIDPMRSKHAKEFYPLVVPVVKASIDQRPALDEKNKAAAKAAVDVLYKMLDEAILLKVLDLFIDAHASADGKNTLIGGIRAADGNKAVDALKQFPNIRPGWKWTENVDEHQGVKLHSLTVAPHRAAVVQALCGGEPIIHFGTSKDAVWFAAGQNAVQELKAAIDAVQKPVEGAVDPTFLQMDVRLHVVTDVLDAYRGSFPPGTSKEEIRDEKQRAQWRKYGIDAFAEGKDQLTAKLVHQGSDVQGDFNAGHGALKFVGTMLADFIKENF